MAGRDEDTAEAKDMGQLPVDKGWAWVILAASTLITILYAGTFKSFGIFYVEILEVYGGTVSTTSLLSSLQFAVYCLTNIMTGATCGLGAAHSSGTHDFTFGFLEAVPIMTILLRHYSIRSCQLAGILITALGFGLSSLTHTLQLLILTQSILGGLGMALVFPTTIVLIGKYFRKRTGLANGIMMSGYSIGGVVLPPLLRYILDEYKLSGAFLLTAGVILNCLPPACLLRPMVFYTNKIVLNQQKSEEESENVVNCENRQLEYPKSVLLTDKGNIEGSPVYLTKGKPNTSRVPLLTDTFPDSQHVAVTGVASSTPILPSSHHETNHLLENDQVHSSPHIDNIMTSKPDSRIQHSEPCIVRYLSTGELISLSTVDIRWADCSEKSRASEHGESLIKRVFAMCISWQMCTPKLWRNSLFLILIPIYCFGSVGPETVHLFTPSFAKDRGVGSSRIAVLVSVQCLCDFVGRVLSGYLADLPGVRRQQIVMATQLISGLLLQLTPFFRVYWTLVLFMAVYGLTAGIIFSLFPPILAVVVGQDMFPTSVAIMILIKGAFVCGVIPILGFLRDSTLDYHATFHFMGGLSLIAVLFLIVFDVTSLKLTKMEKYTKATPLNAEL